MSETVGMAAARPPCTCGERESQAGALARCHKIMFDMEASAEALDDEVRRLREENARLDSRLAEETKACDWNRERADKAWKENARLAEALRIVEWNGPWPKPEGGRCPCCASIRPTHTDECNLNAALAGHDPAWRREVEAQAIEQAAEIAEAHQTYFDPKMEGGPIQPRNPTLAKALAALRSYAERVRRGEV